MLPYSERITMIEGLVVDLRRPGMVGRNARLGLHGDTVHDPIVRVHTSGGAVGIGWSRLKREQAETLLGSTLGDLFHLPEGCTPAGRIVDPVLWDLAARMLGKPLYQVIGEPLGSREVEVYDSSIYHDDFGADDDEAVKIQAWLRATAISRSRSGGALDGCPWMRDSSGTSWRFTPCGRRRARTRK